MKQLSVTSVKILATPIVCVVPWTEKSGVMYGLKTPFIYEVKLGGYKIQFDVPEGFTYDSASLPMIAKMFFDKSDTRLLWSSACHDDDYSYAINKEQSYIPNINNNGVYLTRKQIDTIFRMLMIELGFPLFWSWVFYFSVRMFGWLFFKPSEKFSGNKLTMPQP